MAKAPFCEEMPSIVEDATRIVLNARAIPLTPEMFFELCADNSDLFLELTAQKRIIIMSPAGATSDSRNVDLSTQLHSWASKDKTGKTFGPTAGFRLPKGGVRSPDVSWILRSRWDRLSEDEQERFPLICPDFVAELRSRTNTLKELKAKMVEYIENGARLGWLIDPYEKKVYVYRPGAAPECLDNPGTIGGEPVLNGFVLDLSQIFG